MPGIRWIRLLVPGVALVILTGCNPFSEARPMMDEYVERLARVLETEPRFSDLQPVSQIPRRRERVLSMPELDIGMLDFLSLYGCKLQRVVGEKNSVMGRVMQPLNRLRYELNFIREARECLPEVEDEELIEALESAIEGKRDSLPIAIWNATWGVEEVESLFTLAKGEYPVAPEGNPVSDLVIELKQLNEAVSALLGGDLDTPLVFAGAVHQRWQAEYRAGQLINSASLLITRLNDATALIRQKLEGPPLCLNGKPNDQSDIVQGMFFSVYIEKIQPYMGAVQQARATLIEPLAALAEKQSSVMPPGFDSWFLRHLSRTGEKSLWRQLDEAMMRHTRSWQELLEQCGLRPGA
ncbi:DUF3080 domain-containing protein [Marinobacter sediminum]|uniref:DUF3080 domain-containing protein n=1 Tax=Marinobacter sediminum TaxID=256323 RepID=UPI00202F4A7A|nr:DUF3080 domain-containing protein [Marinobacter sediminum]MCM0612512.1 DUF3080 domain-containing protein [Marinobacter sediminum]